MDLSQLPPKEEILKVVLENGKLALAYCQGMPMWVKLSAGTAAAIYAYFRHRWTVLELKIRLFHLTNIF